MELILENTKTMVSDTLKLLLKPKFLTFYCHPHHFYKLSPPVHPSSNNIYLDTSHLTASGGTGLHVEAPSFEKMADSPEGLIVPIEWYSEMKQWLLTNSPVLLSETSRNMLEPEAVLKLSAPEEPSSPWSSQRLNSGGMYVLPAQEMEWSRWPISQKGVSLVLAKTTTEKKLWWNTLAASRET